MINLHSIAIQWCLYKHMIRYMEIDMGLRPGFMLQYIQEWLCTIKMGSYRMDIACHARLKRYDPCHGMVSSTLIQEAEDIWLR